METFGLMGLSHAQLRPQENMRRGKDAALIRHTSDYVDYILRNCVDVIYRNYDLLHSLFSREENFVYENGVLPKCLYMTPVSQRTDVFPVYRTVPVKNAVP